MIHWEDRRRVHQACDPEGDGELKMRLQLIDTGGVIRHVLVRGRVFFRQPLCRRQNRSGRRFACWE